MLSATFAAKLKIILNIMLHVDADGSIHHVMLYGAGTYASAGGCGKWTGPTSSFKVRCRYFFNVRSQ